MPEQTQTMQQAVPAATVREHLRTLKAAGATHALLAFTTGLSATTISAYARAADRPAARDLIPIETAERILAVTPAWVRDALANEALLAAARARTTNAPQTVPIAAVRDHLRSLKDAGVPNALIAREAGVSESSIANYAHPTDHPRARSVVPADAADGILAISLAWAKAAATDPAVDAAATRRRIATLTAAGHSARAITTEIGGPIPTGRLVTHARADAVTAAYDKLAPSEPRYQSPAERTEARLLAAQARRDGAKLPHEWLSIEHNRTCDAPDPAINRPGIEAVCEGRWQRLTDAEYVAAINQMREADVPPTTITNRVQLPQGAADRFIARVAAGERVNHGDQVLRSAEGSRKTPIEPAAAHIEDLITLGATPTSIARATGLSKVTIHNYRGLNPSRPAPALIPHEIADRILALTADDVDLDALTDAAATSRRLRALATRGYSAAMISEATGIKPATIEHIHRGDTTAVRTRNSIAAFYDQVAYGKPPEYSSARQRGIAQAFRKRAIERGWLTPLDYDDIERGILAEPTEVAAPPVVERAAPEPTATAAHQRVRDLCNAHWTHPQIAEAAGISKTMVANYSRRAGAKDGRRGHRMRQDIADRILAIEVDVQLGRGRVCADPTKAHLRAALADGTTLRTVAQRMRLPISTLRDALDASTVRNDIAQTIAAHSNSTTTSRKRPTRRHPRPIAQLVPKAVESVDVDEIAVELFLAGEAIALTSAERDHALVLMDRRGDSVAQMQRTLGLNERAFATMRARVLGVVTGKAA